MGSILTKYNFKLFSIIVILFTTGLISTQVFAPEANVLPEAIDDNISTNSTLTTDEDSPKAFTSGTVILSNDSDTVDDTISVQSFNFTGLIGNITSSDTTTATFTYDPNSQFEFLATSSDTAVDSFTYVIVDTSGATDIANVTITITGINDAPIARNDTGINFTTNEDTAFTTGNVLGNDTDVDIGNVLTVIALTLTNSSDVFSAPLTNNNNGTVDYDPSGIVSFQQLDTGVNATDSFTYLVSDGTQMDMATVFIVIVGVNDPPDAQDDNVSYTEDDAARRRCAP